MLLAFSIVFAFLSSVACAECRRSVEGRDGWVLGGKEVKRDVCSWSDCLGEGISDSKWPA
jgi:hypothetical protein